MKTAGSGSHLLSPKNEIRVPFFQPEISDAEIGEVVNALQKGWITTGPRTYQFERDFLDWLQQETTPDTPPEDELHALAVNSATAGLHLALEAIGAGPGDEVLVPVMTFTASAEIIRYLGADPVFVDIDPATLNLDINALEAAITPRSKAIIVVHFAGLAADMTAILALARRHGLKVIEDAAHALPCFHGNRKIGTLASDATVFSFYATKTITTGEGGMLVTRHQQVAERAKTMRLHGIDRDAFARYTSKSAAWRYDIVAPGYKYNMTDLAASLGIHQLAKADAFQQRRQTLAKAYDDALGDLPLVLPPHAPANGLHAWHLYVIRLEDTAPVGRDELIDRLYEKGVACSVHFIPLHHMTYWQERYNLSAEDFPVAEHYFKGCLTLPLYTAMEDEQLEYVASCLRTLLT